MAPFLSSVLFSRNLATDPLVTTDEFRTQWITPGDVFSVLLILGGDVVGRAIAQLAGPGLTPVAFSFGWVAYSISAVVSAVGENKLMPPDPDCRCKVIHGKSGYGRDNSSWILGRIMRDFDYWKDHTIQRKLEEILEARLARSRTTDKNAARPTMAGLVVSIYEPSTTVLAGTIAHDTVFWIGLPVMVLQLGIAAIPCALWRQWGELAVTVVGISLSLATGALPQWKKEKWACRDKSEHDYILTRGNGSQHAIVIRGNGHGFILDDLASGQSNLLVATNTSTRICLCILAILWILLLITAAGMKQNTWFLLAIGAIGTMQNIYVAGNPRRPENFGIPLNFVEVYGQPSVMQTLLEVEEKYENVGRAMVQEFFPGSLREVEIQKWNGLKEKHQAARFAKAKADM